MATTTCSRLPCSCTSRSRAGTRRHQPVSTIASKRFTLQHGSLL
jgi:hypothetical protein